MVEMTYSCGCQNMPTAFLRLMSKTELRLQRHCYELADSSFETTSIESENRRGAEQQYIQLQFLTREEESLWF
jgi:hypothetical protein